MILGFAKSHRLSIVKISPKLESNQMSIKQTKRTVNNIKAISRLKTIAAGGDVTEEEINKDYEGKQPPWFAKAKQLVLKLTANSPVRVAHSHYESENREQEEEEESYVAFQIMKGHLMLSSGAAFMNLNLIKLLYQFCIANDLDFEIEVIKGKLYVAFTSNVEMYRLGDLFK
jgi:hypothetical protein